MLYKCNHIVYNLLRGLFHSANPSKYWRIFKSFCVVSHVRDVPQFNHLPDEGDLSCFQCCCCLVAKLCPTLLQPHGLYSPPGSSVHGICFSSSSLVAKLCLTLVTPWMIALQVPLSVGFSRQEFWSGLPFPSPGDLPNPGIEPGSPALQSDSLWTELQGNLPQF